MSEVRKRHGTAAGGETPAAAAAVSGTAADLHEKKPRQASRDSSRQGFSLDLRLIVVTLVALALRVYNIGTPAEVVWDEVHFGKFAVFYNLGKFFFDVHPPLAKLLLALAGWIGDMDTKFMFDTIGQSYRQSNVPYLSMRMCGALLGTGVVALVYLILVELKCTRWTAFAGAAFVAFDNAQICISRFILLDAPLLFFCFLAVFCFLKFHNQRQSFSPSWWAWMIATGVSLALVVSVKYVGIFAMGLLGLLTLSGLWQLWSNLSVPIPLVLRHFLARVFGLILVPVALYIALFALHLQLLPRSGPGDQFMSLNFQAELVGSSFNQRRFAPRDVGIGSVVLIRNARDQRCWLHSHSHRYPIYPSGDERGYVSSHQQQVTCYPFFDDTNNYWRLEDASIPFQFNATKPAAVKYRPLRHGDVVRLVHAATGQALNSHDVAGPLTYHGQEVSCYGPGDERAPPGQPGHMPLNDKWIVQIATAHDKSQVLQPFVHEFRLVHVLTQAALQTTGKVLPDWGYKQLEVVANRHETTGTNSLWTIDDHQSRDARASGDKIERPRMNFWQKFVELHRTMFRANNELLQEHAYGSRPIAWAPLTRGLAFWHGKENNQIYLLGNPILWWASLAALVLYIAVLVVYTLLSARRITVIDVETLDMFNYAGLVIWTGWFLHYLPFFFMARQLFLHHYLPAAIFSHMMLAFLLEHFTLRLLRRAKLYYATLLVATAGVIWCFWYFAPITYGWPLTNAQATGRKWLQSWNIKDDFR